MMRIRRARERGQMIPLAGLMAVVILGAGALAVDLSLQTHDRRSLQNVSDAAALAGAQDLLDPNSATAQNGRINAVVTAIKLMHTQLGFNIPNSNYATQWAQSGASCVTSGSICYADNITAGEYTFSIDAPPKTADKYGQGAYNGDSRYIEVTLRRTMQNAGFGGVVGQPTGTVGAHSVAFHQVPGTHFGFALWANTVASVGNEVETIIGDAYAYRNVNPQSKGQSAFCVAKNADGTGGHLVLGHPQYPNTDYPSPDPANGLPQQYQVAPNSKQDPDFLHFVNSCAATGSGWIAQEATIGCPSSVQGTTLGAGTYVDTNLTGACVAKPAITAPLLPGPTDTTDKSSPICQPSTSNGKYWPGYYSCTGKNQVALTVDHTLAKGVYYIQHNPNAAYDVLINGSSVSGDSGTRCPSAGYQTYICGVTFILAGGATIEVIGNSSTAVITPYDDGSGSLNQGVFPVYSAIGDSGTVDVHDNGDTLTMTGTVYMPGGTVSVGQNAYVFIQGQAIVNKWDVTSGNHPNPDIYWDANRVASENEVLRLVE